MTRWKHLWGPEVQTPSYILSPLDSGPQDFSLECPISFSPFLPFGTLGNTAGDGGVFLQIYRFKDGYIKLIGFTSILTRMFAGCFTRDNQRLTIGCNAALRGPAIKNRIRYQFLI